MSIGEANGEKEEEKAREAHFLFFGGGSCVLFLGGEGRRGRKRE